MSKELVFLFPVRRCNPSLPLPPSVFPRLSVDILNHFSIFPPNLQTFTFHPSRPLASIILSFHLLLISFPPPSCQPPSSSSSTTTTGSLVIKAHAPLMVGKAHWLSWSASGFTVSSSANIIRAICAHTHIQTNFAQLKTDCCIRWSFPFRGLCLEIYLLPSVHPLPATSRLCPISL